MSVQDVLTSLRQQRAKVRASGKVQWYAQCPAHDDHEPSLSITQRPDGGVLLKCHRGCETEDVVAALGLQWADLFPPRVELGRPRVTRYPVNGAIHPSFRSLD